MSIQTTIRNLFRRRRDVVEPEQISPKPFKFAPEPPLKDDRPEWQKRIDRINALCEERKAETRMTKGGRTITDPYPEEGIFNLRQRGAEDENGDRPN